MGSGPAFNLVEWIWEVCAACRIGTKVSHRCNLRTSIRPPVDCSRHILLTRVKLLSPALPAESHPLVRQTPSYIEYPIAYRRNVLLTVHIHIGRLIVVEVRWCGDRVGLRIRVPGSRIIVTWSDRNKKSLSPFRADIHSSIHCCITAFDHRREPVTCSSFLGGPDSGHVGG